MATQLHVATDIYDEVLQNERLPEPRHLLALMRYCRSLGASTIQWILDDMWSLYEARPGGMDLLATAVEAAHSEGLEFHVVYKPFEGALATILLPSALPKPPGAVVWEDLDGLTPIVRPFVAAHPEFCLKRRPGDRDPGQALGAIRLVKNDDGPAALRAGDVAIRTGSTNGRFEPYDGRVVVDETLEWRPLFPLGRTCRIVTLSGLRIPAAQRYLEIRFGDAAFAQGPFRNEYGALVELVGEDGAPIPSTTANAEPPREHYARHLAKPAISQLVRYGQHPEVKAFLADARRVTEAAGDLQAYTRAGANPEYALDVRRRVAVARGKLEHLPGILNPVYPEVREEWLRTVRFCIERGADAVNFRTSSHLNAQEMWAYGFNEPVLRALEGEVDLAEAGRIMGDAYTGFLREARELLHASGRRLGVHLLTNFVRERDEQVAPLRETMEYQWETWVGEIADLAVVRGAMGFREPALSYVVDRFAAACRRRGVSLVYQSNRRSFVARPDALHLHPDRRRWLEHEMTWVRRHRGIAGFELYETANFTCLDAAGEFRGSDEIRDIVRRCGLGAG